MGIYIGTSGWSYDHWTGVLYPEGTPPYRRLDFYTGRFGTVELNAAYYRWPRDTAFASWRKRLPDGFQMSVKAPGLLTHRQRLYGPEGWWSRIRASLGLLEWKAGPLLVQLSPRFAFDYRRLEYFLQVKPDGVRVAVEFRHPSWLREDVFGLLERFGAAYCVMSGANLPCVLRATASFVYVRLHGPDGQHLYGGSYPEEDLCWWRDRLHEWAGMGKDVYVYFNNDGGGNAVRNALRLRELAGA